MKTHVIAKARNIATGQTVVAQDLTGTRFTLAQRALAEDSAEQFALRLTQRTGVMWVGFTEEYLPTSRG
jgi:hypothetical protein